MNAWLSVGVLLVLAASIGYGLSQPRPTVQDTPLFGWEQPRALQPFYLHRSGGEPFGLDQLHGQWTLIFSGYSNCPDLCPITLALLDQWSTHWRASQRSALPQLVFVSLDTVNDTPAVLADYLSYFGAPFVGISGAPAEVNALLQPLGFYLAGYGAGSAEYPIVHSSSVALIDPQANVVALIRQPFTLSAISQQLRAHQLRVRS